MDALTAASSELGKPAAQVALNWVATQPGITSTILGATKLAQLDDNLASLDFSIPRPKFASGWIRLPRLMPCIPTFFSSPCLQDMITGGVKIEAWAPARI